MNVSPANSGYVNVGGVRLSSYPAYESLTPGTEVTLEAVPVLGYRFSSWSGDIGSLSKKAVIRANSDQMATMVTANFSLLIPSWLIATIATATAVAIILWWRRRRSEQVDPNLSIP